MKKARLPKRRKKPISLLSERTVRELFEREDSCLLFVNEDGDIGKTGKRGLEFGVGCSCEQTITVTGQRVLPGTRVLDHHRYIPLSAVKAGLRRLAQLTT